MSYDPQEFQTYLSLWKLEQHSKDWPLYASPEADQLLRDRAASFGGLISISHFIRSFEELRAEGKIKQLRQPRPAVVEESELTAEQYRSMPTQTIIRKYQSDRDFKIGVDTDLTGVFCTR